MTPRRPPPTPSPQALREAALDYLSRRAASSRRLTQVLQRRLLRWEIAGAAFDREEALGWIAALVDKLQADGLLDDTALAEARSQRLQDSGTAPAGIRRKLQQGGLGGAALDAGMAALEGEGRREAAVIALLQLARRRRYGPYAAEEPSAESAAALRLKLRRAGHDDSALRLVWALEDADTADALLADLQQGAVL